MPADAAEVSSRVLLALALPETTPVNPKPGSSTNRLLTVPLPPKATAVPPFPMIVPAFASVPPTERTTPLGAPVIVPAAALVTDPPGAR